MLGALVGGVASGAASWWIARDVARRDAVAHDRSVALKLVVKSKLLADSAYSIHSQIEETIAEAEKAGIDGPTWSKLSGLLNFSGPSLYLSADESALLIQMKDDDLTNDFILLTHRIQTLEGSLSEYEKRRRSLTENFHANSMNGRVGSTLFTEKEIAALAPRMVDVEILADDIRQRAKKDTEAAIQLVRSLGPVIKEYLKDPSFPVGHIPE